MSSPSRSDRIFAAASGIAILMLAALIVAALQSADRNGRKALESLQTSQLQQLARSMDARVRSLSTGVSALTQQPWVLQPNAPGDAALLAAYTDPSARTGVVLVDASSRVVGGVKLQSIAVGAVLERPGLRQAMANSETALLPVASGVTTSLPTIALVLPLRSVSGGTGALVYEVDVSAQSVFNAEVSQLGRGRTGEFFFLDQNGVVIASSNAALIGRPIDQQRLVTDPTGFSRRNGDIIDMADVPSAHWRAVFRQAASEFDGPLRAPLHNALLLVALGGVVAAGFGSVLLFGRLRRAREEQRRLAQLNDTREEFVSIVSHELRTPVAGVVGFLQTTLDHWDVMTDEDRHRAVSRANANARRMQGLTRDVLDASRLESGELSYTFRREDLRAAVSEATDIERELHPEYTFSLQLPEEPVWVEVDSERVQQVVFNLLDNARASSAAGAPIEVRVASENGGAVLTVTDHGVGFQEAALDRLFDKFVRGRAGSVQGTGLGLYICRRIVDAHRGSIWASSERGQGATFHVSLPAAAPSQDLSGGAAVSR